MRLLKFIVDKQKLEIDPDCDFSGLVKGSAGYLKADFSFSSEWDGFVKVISFETIRGEKEFTPQILKDGRRCYIPSEALEERRFRIRVLGKKDNSKLITNTLTITQGG